MPSDLASWRLLDTPQAAAYLGVQPSTLKTWRTRGGGPVASRVGGRAVRYRVCDLDEFVRAEARTVGPPLRGPGGQVAGSR